MIVRVDKNQLFEKFNFRSDFVNFGIHFGPILGALGHHFATFGRSVATLVGRMADASTWLKMGSDWGGGEGGATPYIIGLSQLPPGPSLHPE